MLLAVGVCSGFLLSCIAYVTFVAFLLKGRYHNPFVLFLIPFITTIPLYITNNSSLFIMILQPALQSCVKDISEWFFMPGMVYADVAAFGRGKSSSHLCDDSNIVASSNDTLTCLCCFFLVLVLALSVK